MKFDIDILNRYKEAGLLYNQEHPNLPLLIWNYSQKIQYEGLWDDITLNCRGLVTDLNGNVVSRGFSKFFNIEENRHTPTNDFEIFEKLDGQYIGVFWYDGEMIVNSRGSFTSEYATEAKRIFNEKYPKFEIFANGDWAYCFELIGYEQIVVSYPEPDLVLTGIFCRRNFGAEWSINCHSIQLSILRCVKKFSGLDWQNIKQLNWKNSEGFVVRFANGSRCKIKFEDYVRLHRIMTNFSEKSIWQILSNGKTIESELENVPDEFFEEVKGIEYQFQRKYTDIVEYCHELLKTLDLTKSRKELAVEILKFEYPSIIFTALDHKPIDKIIWNILKPRN